MALENVTYISDLDPVNPGSSDTITQGDNHIRNLKLALKNTFPNVTTPITVTAEEINAVAGMDAAITAAAQNAWPVGSIYLSGVSTNPATLLGFGTWVRVAEGRAIVGVGDNGEYDWANGETRGSDTVTLSEANIPSHYHTINPPSTSTNSTGSHSHGAGTYWASAKSSKWYTSTSGNDDLTNPRLTDYTDNTSARGTSLPTTKNTTHGHDIEGTSSSAGSHSHTVDIPQFNSGSVGSGTAFTNTQPSVAIYIWQRTA